MLIRLLDSNKGFVQQWNSNSFRGPVLMREGSDKHLSDLLHEAEIPSAIMSNEPEFVLEVVSVLPKGTILITHCSTEEEMNPLLELEDVPLVILIPRDLELANLPDEFKYYILDLEGVTDVLAFNFFNSIDKLDGRWTPCPCEDSEEGYCEEDCDCEEDCCCDEGCDCWQDPYDYYWEDDDEDDYDDWYHEDEEL